MLKKILCLLCAVMLLACAHAEVLLDNWDSIARIPGSDDLFLICKDDLWGLARRDGTVVIEPQYNNQPEFANGYAVVSVGVPGASVDLSDVPENAFLFGVIDNQGNIIVPAQYQKIEISPEADIMLVLQDEKYGYMDMQGKFIIEPEYDRARMFAGEYAAVAKFFDLGDENRDSMGYTTCWGMIDRSGKERIPLGYDWLEASENGIAAVQLNQKWGFINAENKTIVDFKYYSAGSFKNGYAPVAIKENIHGTSGDDSKDITSSWGIIDESGKEVVSCKYLSLQIGDSGIALVQDHASSSYGYIDMQDKTIIEPSLYRAEPFIGKLAAVGRRVDLPDGRVNIRWGVVDAEGKEILPMDYSWVEIDPDGSIEAMLKKEIVRYEMTNGAAVKIAE